MLRSFNMLVATLEIVSQNSDQLILKTSSKYRLYSGCFLPLGLTLGVVAIALGVGWILLLVWGDTSLLQSLWLILISTAAITVGVALPTRLLLSALTTQTWKFDRTTQKLHRIRKRFYQTRIFDYPLVDIAEVYIKRSDTDSTYAYRIELIFSNGKRLPISSWSVVHETEVAESITKFLQL